MSGDTSYQVRHKEWGVFQGEMLGMGFWTAISDMPEQGLCEFPSFEAAVAYVQRLADCESAVPPADLTIEPFDRAGSSRMIAEWSGRYDKPAGMV